MNCHDVDALGAAFALDAVNDDERRAIETHLLACPQAHAETRAAIGVGIVLAVAVEPMEPSAALRDRVLASVERTQQGHHPQPAVAPAGEVDASRGWLSGGWLRGLALGGAAATLMLAVASGALWGQLQDRDAQLRATVAAITGGQAVHRVESPTATGFLVETDAGATLLLGSVAPLPDDKLYELWLIDADGSAFAAGTFRPAGEGIVVVELERGTAGFVAVAATVEAERVDQPTSEPVFVTQLQG